MKKPSSPKPRITQDDATQQIIDCGKDFYARGWMAGTAGNLSVKLAQDPLTIAITPSGLNKGRLRKEDILVREEGHEKKVGRPGLVASAETAIHEAIHQALPGCGAVFHVHPMFSTLMSALHGDAHEPRMLRMNWFEMLKGIGVSEQEACEVAILPNWQDVSKIGRDVLAYLARAKDKALPLVLIYNHGITAWGTTTEQAQNHLEIMEYVCEYLYRKQQGSSIR